MSNRAQLSDDDVAHFQQKGWVKAQGFFSPEESRLLTRWTEEICAMPEIPGRQMVYWEDTGAYGRVIQRIENFCPYHADMDQTMRAGRLMAAIETLLGGRSVLYKDKCNLKPPGGSGFELHQDQQAGWSTYAPIFITAMISIDRATEENGCLQIVDMPRQHAILGEEWKPLTAAEVGGALVPVPTEPGDVLFFDSFVAHASEPNRSEQQRRILYLTYNRQDHGDHRSQYFYDKRQSFPPDVERVPGREYKFRV